MMVQSFCIVSIS